jgi:hypothetical protein
MKAWEFPSQVPEDGASFRKIVIERLRDLVGYLRRLTKPQQVEGWYYDNLTAALAATEMTRAGGRWMAVRPGSVTGVGFSSNVARSGGTATVTVYKNTGLAGAAGSTTGLSATLDATNTSRKATTQGTNLDTYAAGDELYLVITSDASWAPTTADVRAALEVSST